MKLMVVSVDCRRLVWWIGVFLMLYVKFFLVLNIFVSLLGLV